MESTGTKPRSDPDVESASIQPAEKSAPPFPLSHLLSSGTPIILDGALATYLETLGADVSSALWSARILVDNPELIYQTHLDYYQAGANVAITASYQASIPGLVKGLEISEADAKKIVKKSVDLAQRARHDWLQGLSEDGRNNMDDKTFIAGSVGPYGAFLADGSEYRGDYSLSQNEFKTFHRGRIDALVEAGVHILACETMPSVKEVRALVELLADEFPGTPAWFTFTLRDESHISDGTSLDRVVELLEPYEQVKAIGINCVPDVLVIDSLTTLRASTRKALVVYPNSGETWNAEKRDWEGERHEGGQLSMKAKEWVEKGANMVGGCCRTTPSDIRVFTSALVSDYM